VNLGPVELLVILLIILVPIAIMIGVARRE
jgi:hypothetical protein